MTRVNTRGFALVAVLWVLVAVGSISVVFQAAARAERRSVAHARSVSRTQWAARAGLARAVSQLENLLPNRGLAPVGDTLVPPLQFRMEDIAVRVVTLDVRARLHLNEADEQQLRRFFVGIGMRGARAENIVQAMLDWRDPDGIRRPRGAERAQYAALQPPSAPKNGPFTRVAELHQVYGMLPIVIGRAAPYLTVLGDGLVNVNSASRPVLQSLPGIDAEAALVIIERRRRKPFRNRFDVVGILPSRAQESALADMDGLASRIAFYPRQVEIVARATIAGSPSHTELRAAVNLVGGGQWQMLQVLEQ